SLNSERLRIQNARRARFICAQARAADQFLSGIMQSESSSLFGSFEIYKWTNKFCPVLQSSSVSITSSAVQYSQVQSNEKISTGVSSKSGSRQRLASRFRPSSSVYSVL